MQLRPYQARATEATMAHVRRSVSPVLIDAAPATGKTFLAADLARQLHEISKGKRVLVLAPNATLVEQNFEKFKLTGYKASIFSASAGEKSTKHYIIFGTPKTVLNAIERFKKDYCAIIIDECHELTPTIKEIIKEMREANPNIRIIGMSGTPFRLGEGYVFREWPDGKINDESTSRNPYFSHCTYRVTAREMLDEGFLTPMKICEINAERYNTSGIRLLPNGKFNASDVEMAFEGHGRKTAMCVADVVRFAQTCTGGVMLFAATRQHAKEVLASLPPNNSAMVTGEECILNGKEVKRKDVLKAYHAQKIRYLVSVGTLTTGFDSPWTQVVALLRYTESAALLIQILGRAWRLFAGKTCSFLLDYAGNVEKHFEDGDIYNPTITARKAAESGGGLKACCPQCGNENIFSADMKYIDYEKDAAGYILDLDGNQVMSDYGPIPGHHGRRCYGHVQQGPRGEYSRCEYRWSHKKCLACDAENDIAARYCCSCKAEIISPDEKLQIEFKALKKDPTKPQTDEVVSMRWKEGVSRNGNKTMRVEIVTPYRTFEVFLLPEGRSWKHQKAWEAFLKATENMTVKPRSVSYVKNSETKFFDILGYNGPVDEFREVA